MAEDVDAGLGVGPVALQRREDDPRGAEHDRQRSRPDHPDPERARLLVAGARDLGRLRHPGQPLQRDPERLADLAAPLPPRDVEQQRSGGVRRVDRVLPREPEPHVILREQHVRHAGPDLGLVLAHPQQLRRGEPGQRAVPRQLDQPRQADRLLDLRALRAGPLVVPEDRRPEYQPIRVEQDEPVHLAGETERPVAAGEHALRRAPPVLRVLLCPAGLRDRERILLLGPRQHLARLGDPNRLDAGRPDVDAQKAQAPRAAYTISYARTASFAACASRSAASSIFAATPSMNRHWSTDRFTAATASSVYG